MADKNAEIKYLLPEIIFKESDEIIDAFCIIKLAIDGGMPISFNFDGKERIVEPKFIFKVNGKDYLIGYDVENDELGAFDLSVVGLIFLVKSELKHSVLDILSGAAHFCFNPHAHALQKILKKRIAKPIVMDRQKCCKPAMGKKIIGEIDGNGKVSIHSVDCNEAKKYWWG